MKVLLVASEVAPFAKTGGLGDVAGALPIELKKQGVDVRVIMPRYGCIFSEYLEQMRFVGSIYVRIGWRNQYCSVFELEFNGVTFYFVDSEYYFGGWQIYGGMWQDIERFCFFSKCALSLLPTLDFKPDIIHCNDWQTAAIPVILSAHYLNNPFFLNIKTIMTIHNLKFQGIYDKSTIQDLCDLDDKYFTPDKLEFYKDANLLKGGLVYCDYITTVSPTYAQEIRTPYYSEGLHGILNARAHELSGILNGIDQNEYNPKTDPFIYAQYDKRNFVSKKRLNKVSLQRDLGLEESEDKFLIGMVARLSSQKGFDLLEEIIDELCTQPDVQLAVLGTGEERFENLMRGVSWRHSGQVASVVNFDHPLAHKIYAASDSFLMPSHYEPCGLGQLIALRYGALPIVRETGGLKDTVEPYNEFENTGVGFSFANYDANEMLQIINYALSVFRDKNTWNQMVRRAMSQDFSWKASASQYLELYEKLKA